MRAITQAERDALEALIDSCGLCNAVYALAGIAAEKADHVRASYNDKKLAQMWNSAGVKLATVAASPSVCNVSR